MKLTLDTGIQAAAEGARTLVWDLDPQGAASFYFRVKPKVKGGSEALITGRRALDRLPDLETQVEDVVAVLEDGPRRRVR